MKLDPKNVKLTLFQKVKVFPKLIKEPFVVFTALVILFITWNVILAGTMPTLIAGHIIIDALVSFAIATIINFFLILLPAVVVGVIAEEEEDGKTCMSVFKIPLTKGCLK